MIKFLLPFFAIAGIVVMEVVAISHGIDGKLLTFSVATVAGIGGFFLRSWPKKPSR